MYTRGREELKGKRNEGLYIYTYVDLERLMSGNSLAQLREASCSLFRHEMASMDEIGDLRGQLT